MTSEKLPVVRTMPPYPVAYQYTTHAAWQACPVCDGTGKMSSINAIYPCATCNETGLLSIATGCPPKKEVEG